MKCVVCGCDCSKDVDSYFRIPHPIRKERSPEDTFSHIDIDYVCEECIRDWAKQFVVNNW